MYQIENPITQAMSGMSQAAGSYGRMMPNIPANQRQKPSVGGAAMAGAGGAMAGMQAGSLLGASAAVPAAASATGEAIAGATAMGMGPVGWAGAGLLVGIGSYLFS